MIEIELSELNEEDGSSSTQEPEETLETSENLNTTYLSSEHDASFNCTSSEENLNDSDLEKWLSESPAKENQNQNIKLTAMVTGPPLAVYLNCIIETIRHEQRDT